MSTRFSVAFRFVPQSFSLTHGANDGQKTMGVITALLIAGGLLDSQSFVVPTEVILGLPLLLHWEHSLVAGG